MVSYGEGGAPLPGCGQIVLYEGTASAVPKSIIFLEQQTAHSHQKTQFRKSTTMSECQRTAA